METYKLLIVFAVAAAGILSRLIWQRKSEAARLKRIWGAKEAFKNLEDELVRDIERGFQLRRAGQDAAGFVDDITWNDLNMDDVFRRLDATVSVAGSERLYSLLRSTCESEERMAARRAQADRFADDETLRFTVQRVLGRVGKSHFHGAYDFMAGEGDLSVPHLKLLPIPPAVMLLCLIAAVFVPQFIVGAILMLALTAFLYFRYSIFWRKEQHAVGYLLSVMKAAEKLIAVHGAMPRKDLEALRSALGRLKSIRGWAGLLVSGDQSMMGVVTEYVCAFLMLDLLAVRRIARTLRGRKEDMLLVMDRVGDIDAALSLAQAKQRFALCAPVFVGKRTLRARNVRHPLIEDCVGNDIEWKGGVLLTGSNASGKSTFIKALAVNAILAQGLGVCFADAFSLPRADVATSMAIRDDVQAGESYFVRELKSLKRLMDWRSGERALLCFIDEILRGTNTVERIAASSSLLERMAENGIMVMAATHDIELTRMLENSYRNMHFREEVTERGIRFTFKLHEGASRTRNAISLLERLGFDGGVARKSRERANAHDMTGVWR